MAASSASAKPAPWEVWLAYLRFADHPEAGYTDLNRYAEDAMREATLKKLTLFGSAGKA